jgi:hypothetical protein
MYVGGLLAMSCKFLYFVVATLQSGKKMMLYRELFITCYEKTLV